MSILPYCFRSSLFACFIASTVAIVLRKFSVASAADSILNVCCESWASWDSYIRFCLSVRSARSCIAFYFRTSMIRVLDIARVRTLPGPLRSLLICSLYLPNSPSSFLILTSIEAILVSVCEGNEWVWSHHGTQSNITDRRNGILKSWLWFLACGWSKESIHGV